MNIPVKKLKSGFEMPIFGLGTWQMGGGTEYDPHNDDDADTQAIKMPWIVVLPTSIPQKFTRMDIRKYWSVKQLPDMIARKSFSRPKFRQSIWLMMIFFGHARGALNVF